MKRISREICVILVFIQTNKNMQLCWQNSLLTEIFRRTTCFLCCIIITELQFNNHMKTEKKFFKDRVLLFLNFICHAI